MKTYQLGDIVFTVFPFKWCPQRVVTWLSARGLKGTFSVSNQMVSPASGDALTLEEKTGEIFVVSNQMVSPASGDVPMEAIPVSGSSTFPIKWCHQRVVTVALERACAAGDPKTVCAPLHYGHPFAGRQPWGKR